MCIFFDVYKRGTVSHHVMRYCIFPLPHLSFMAGKPYDIEEHIAELMGSMDRIDLINTIRRLEREVGPEKTLDCLRGVIGSMEVDFDECKEQVAFDLNQNGKEFFHELNHRCHGPYGYVDPGEASADMILEIVQGYRDEVEKLLSVDRTDEVRAILRAIAEALREADSDLTEYAMDFPDDFASHIEECIDDEEYLDAFDW